jgi:acetyl esterase/lipase
VSRLRRIGLLLAVLIAALVAWEPSRVAIQTAIMLPNLLGAPIRPLDLFSAPPVRSAVPYSSTAGKPELAELWLPAWASSQSRAGAMLLVFGVNNVGRNHPAIVRVAEGLARSGVAVLVPDSRSMLEGRLRADDLDKVIEAFQLLASRPEVDPARVGMVGFSVGGSLALIAAADPRIAARVAWVNAFGAYGDAESYLASVAAHAYVGPSGETVAWEPTTLAREVLLRLLLDAIADPADRALLQKRYGEEILAPGRVSSDSGVRGSLTSDGGRAVYDLLTAGSLAEARRAIASLPAPTRAFIRAISPVEHLDGLRTRVYLMHEIADHHVPFVESRVLASALRERGRLVNHTEFRLFDHVQPDNLDVLAAAPELWKLLWHLDQLMVETL